MEKVVVIGGPTASGKSAFAEKMASDIGGVIINADSLQIYKGLPILTAQPSPIQAHHKLYSILDPQDQCDVARWFHFAKREIKDAISHGEIPIVVGGSGMYLKALLDGLTYMPAVDPMVLAEAKTVPSAALYDEMVQVGLDLPKHIIPEEPQRVIRAWSIWKSTGRSILDWHNEPREKLPYAFETILIWPERDELYRRIDKRFGQMLDVGAVEEVRIFDNSNPCITARKAIGFFGIMQYLIGNMSKEQVVEQAAQLTRNYAKRQMTWFKNQFFADTVINNI